jgi:hypothetical protein
MAPVPAPCSALADQVAVLEAEERSLRAALANLSGFAAWAALGRLSRLQDDLENKFRPALRDCIEFADRLFPGELLVMDATGVDPTAATGDRMIQLWEVTSSGATVSGRHPVAWVTGTWFPIQRPEDGSMPLPQQFGITVLSTDAAGLLAAALDATADVPCDFRSAPISSTAVPSGGPLRVEVVLGPQLRFTADQVTAWVIEAFTPHSQPLSAGGVDAVISMTGASASLINGGIRGTVMGSVSFPGNPLLGALTVPFSIGVGASVRTPVAVARGGPPPNVSTPPLGQIVEVAPLGPPDIHLTGDLGPLGPLATLMSNALGAFVTDLVMTQLRQIMQRELPQAVAHALALPALPAGVTLTIRQLSITPWEISFQPTLGGFGTVLSTFTPPPIPPA